MGKMNQFIYSASDFAELVGVSKAAISYNLKSTSLKKAAKTVGKVKKINIAHPAAIEYMRNKGCVKGLQLVHADLIEQVEAATRPQLPTTSTLEIDSNLVVKARPRITDELPAERYPTPDVAKRDFIVLPESRSPTPGQFEFFVTQAEFTALSGLNAQAVSVKTRKGGNFHKHGAVMKMPTYATGQMRAFINAANPYVIDYLKTLNRDVVVEQIMERATKYYNEKIDSAVEPSEEIFESETIERVPPNRQASVPLDTSDLPDDVRKVVDWPLRKILNKFGSNYSMLEWINAVKRLEDLYEKQLKNSVLEKSYIPRNYVTTHITGAIEEVFVRLLNDAPRTITAKAYELIEAGEPREKVETTVKNAISSQIKNVKNTILLGLRNA